jgi:hypothetical protein
MPPIGDLGFHHVSGQDFIEFRTLINVNPDLITIMLFDPIMLSVGPYERSLRRIFRQTLFDIGFRLFLGHGVSRE